jgi:membrane protease YdiL (CAAX protease family)
LIRKIGLSAPLVALFFYGAIYNKWLLSKLPPPQFFFLISSLFIIWNRKLKSADFGLELRLLPKRLALGLSFGLLSGVSVLSIAAMLSFFFNASLLGGSPIRMEFTKWHLFTLIVLAPLCEELFFRGILLKALREDYSARWAVILSSVIFMLGHGGLFVPGPLVLGLIVGPMMLVTRSIIPGIVFHSMSNLYGPIMVWWFPNLYRHLAFFYQ